MNPTVLHVTTTIGGGVPVAIRSIASAVTSYEHIVLAPIEECPDFALPESHGGRIAEIRRLLRSLQPDVVHAHSSFAGAYCRMATRRSVVYQPHAFKFLDPELSTAKRALLWAPEALLARRGPILALSKREASAASLMGCRDVFVVPNRSHLPKKLLGVGRGATIGMIGRIARQKDPAFFLEVAEEIRAGFPGASFVWIGDAQEGDSSLKRELIAAGVRVTGWIDSHRLVEELSKVSVYVHTASYEGFPLAVLDAARCGVPIVMRDIGLQQELPAPGGRTPKSLARAAHEFLSSPQAYNRGVVLSKSIDAAYSLDAQRSAFTKIYDSVR